MSVEARSWGERPFRVLSYAAVLCGFFSLWISGTFSPLAIAGYLVIAAFAFLIEDSRWQLSERYGTAVTILALPAFFFLWRSNFFEFAGPDTAIPGILARLILTLSAIKLLQTKGDRDWIFLYVMAFFQVLLGAGLSISALYLGTFVLFVLIMTATIVLFENRRTRAQVIDRGKVHRGPIVPEVMNPPSLGRLPITVAALVVLILALALPLFFILPRVGGAGMGGSLGGVSAISGFSDSVRLGGIGRIQQNDEIVMRVRVEDRDKLSGPIRWRGVALDTFDNRQWSKTRSGIKEPRAKGERDLIQVDYASGRDSVLVQTVYLEPLDTPVLFAMTRPVAVQAPFPVVFIDTHGSITFPRSGERTSYRVLSDIQVPSATLLRNDREAYPKGFDNYLQLPDGLDERIVQRAALLTESSTDRYEAARLVEYHLRNDFGYTLEQKAGGDQPLADFLFNVREGHCEYFATAMAIMLRTQGIATRVVNGFQQGEYNETADVFVVRQREAHSWVEVYFPGEEAWVAFDPTPAAAQTTGTGTAGIYQTFTKYLEALEMIWIQYFVAYDDQEQRSLFTSIKRGVSDYNEKTSSLLSDLQELIAGWWEQARGDQGFTASLKALGIFGAIMIGAIFAALVFFWLVRRLARTSLWQRFRIRSSDHTEPTVVEFYQRLQELLASRGLHRSPHMTPLEFAQKVDVPGVAEITGIYNRARFSAGNVSPTEIEFINEQLANIELNLNGT